MDLQVGGTSKFAFRKDGYITTTLPSTSFGGLQNSYNTGFYFRGDYFPYIAIAGTIYLGTEAGKSVQLKDSLGFGSSLTYQGGADTYLARDAASTLALRNGGTAAIPAPQTFRIYNYTDSGLTNYERGFLRWNSNTLEIGTEAGGTGTGRAFDLYSSGTLSARFRGSTYSTIYVGMERAYSSQTADPTTSDVVSGRCRVIRNSTTGALKLWAYNNGTLVSSPIESMLTSTLSASYGVTAANSFTDTTLSVALSVGTWLIQYSAHVVSAAPTTGGTKSHFSFSGTATEASGTHQYSGGTSSTSIEAVAVLVGTAVRKALALDQSSLYSNAGASHRVSGTGILVVTAAGALTFRVCSSDGATLVYLQTPSFITATRIS